MNKRPLSLALSLALALVSAAPAAVREAPVSRRAANASVSISAVVSILTSATPGSLRALGALASPEAALAAQLAARPELLKSLDASQPLAAAVSALQAKIASDPNMAAAVSELRETESASFTARTQSAMKRVTRELGLLSAGAFGDSLDSALSAVGSRGLGAPRLARSSAGGAGHRLRSAMAGALMATSLMLGTPAVAPAEPRPVAAEASVVSAQAYESVSDVNALVKRWNSGTHLYVVGTPVRGKRTRVLRLE